MVKRHRVKQGLVVLVSTAVLLASPAPVGAVGPPQVVSSWITDVTATSLNLRAQLNPNGLPTTYRFEYLTEAAYQEGGFALAVKAPSSGTAPLGTGTSAIAVVQHVGGLEATTTYRYRVSAANSAGTTLGPERTFTTQATSLPFGLPENRGWELVSPPGKGGGEIASPGALFGGGAMQAAAGGGAVTYVSGTAFGSASGTPPASQYLSRRSADGWLTENVSAPLFSGAFGDEPDGTPYRLFSTELGRALLYGGNSCRGELEGCPAPNPPLPGTDAPPGYASYYLRQSAGGTFESLLSAADVGHSSVAPASFEVSFATASPDLSHIVLSSCAALTVDATEAMTGPDQCDPEAQNLYLWSAGDIDLLNVLPGDLEGTPGAEIAAPIGAISSDGSRIYCRQGGDLYLREGSQTRQVDEALGGGGTFEAASVDGSMAFLTREGHLYRYLAATEALTDLTPSGGVTGVLGASSDGSAAYFQNASGLKLWREGTTTTVAAGASAAAPSSFPPATGTAHVTPDGSHLAFLSTQELTPSDNAGTRQAYLYGPPPGGGAARLICASCNPTGERAQGSSSLSGALSNGTTRPHKPRALSADGQRLFFDSNDEFVVHDTNSQPDVYGWRAQGVGDCTLPSGCVALISSGRSLQGASFVDASVSGADAYFTTDGSLVPSDPGSVDLYDARIGGGFPMPQPPIPCIGDACQSLPAPPDDPTPGTLTPNAGNPPLRFFKERQKRKAGKGKGKRKGAKGKRKRGSGKQGKGKRGRGR